MSKTVAVILNFRTAEKTVSCLHSIFKEGVTDVVLIDNSEDQGSSLSEMKPGIDILSAQGLTVNIILNDRNLGFAAGVNLGLGAAIKMGAKYVLIINSDARLVPGSLLLLINEIEAGSDVVIPLTLAEDSTPMNAFLYYQKYLALVSSTPILGAFSYMCGACVLFDISSIKEKLFDDEFFFYGEDILLSEDLKRQGKKMSLVTKAIAHHEGAGSSNKGSLFYEYHINRGHLLLSKKLSCNVFEKALMFLGRVLTLPLRALIRAIRFRNFRPIVGLTFAFSDYFRNKMRTFTPPLH